MAHVEIIAVGSEMLLGGRLDTNSLFLTEQLAALGLEVRFKTVIGDEITDIVSAIRTAAKRAKIIVMTGGLGPTVDDLTRQAVARVTERPLRRRAEALDSMTKRLAEWGRTPTPAQLRQAQVPTDATVLTNPVGSAPGFCLTWQGVLLIVLPGVPAEAREMFSKEAVPHIQTMVSWRARPPIERRMLHTFGILEADLDEKLQPLIPPRSGIRLGLLASSLGVTVSLTVADEKIESKELERVAQSIRDVVGPALYAEGTETLEEVVGRLLSARGLTLAIAESCTGGLIGHRLTQVPGSSAYLDRDVVSYSDRAKIDMLGVPAEVIKRHGAVSAEVAERMAKGIREKSGTHIGLSVTGIAGPGGGTAQKPVGLVYIGLDAKGSGVTVKEFRFHGSRETIKLRASQAALHLLRQWLPLAQQIPS